MNFKVQSSNTPKEKISLVLFPLHNSVITQSSNSLKEKIPLVPYSYSLDNSVITAIRILI
jgi:hypothetical protein